MFGDASALHFSLGLHLLSWLPAGYPELGSRCFILLSQWFPWLFPFSNHEFFRNKGLHSAGSKRATSRQRPALRVLGRHTGSTACWWWAASEWFSLLPTRCTRDRRRPSASRACRQTVNIGSESALAASRRTPPARRNCTAPTAPARCSHLRSRSWFPPAPIRWRSWQRRRKRCVRSASSPSSFSADSRWWLFYSLLSFSTLSSSRGEPAQHSAFRTGAISGIYG